MARIKVAVTATASRLRLEGDSGTFEYSPKDIVSVGNSIGGYLVAPMPGKPHVWGWWRIGGGMIERLRSAPAIHGVTVNGRPLAGSRDGLVAQIMSGEPERVAVNGRTYLFAITAGSARYGVLHAYRPTTDPIQLALESVGCDKNTGRVIDIAEAKGLLQGHYASSVWTAHYSLASDGGVATTPAFIHDAPPTAQSVKQVVGVTGGTYVIQLYEGLNGVSCRREIAVAIAPSADRRIVAQALIRLVREHSRLSSGRNALASA